jgi:hypothetical protein
MGSGKINDILKHLLISDHLGPKGTLFYSKIVYSGSVIEDDETNSTFLKALKTPIVQIPPNNLMQFLNEHIRVKKKYYAIYKFVMNDFKEPNHIMKRIIEKHKLDFFKTSRVNINSNTNRPPIN